MRAVVQTWRVLGAVLSWRNTRRRSGSRVMPCSGNFSLMKSQARVLMDWREVALVGAGAAIPQTKKLIFVQVKRYKVLDAEGKVRGLP